MLVEECGRKYLKVCFDEKTKRCEGQAWCYEGAHTTKVEKSDKRVVRYTATVLSDMSTVQQDIDALVEASVVEELTIRGGYDESDGFILNHRLPRLKKLEIDACTVSKLVLTPANTPRICDLA